MKTLTSATSSKRSSPRPGRNQGFTLIELLVVLAIMGLVIAVAPGAFSSMREGAQYRDTVRTMASELRDARYRATATGRDTEFRINLTARVFGIEGVSLRPIPDTLQIRATVAAQDIGAQGVLAIRFLASGGATGGNVEIARNGGGGARLKVDWLSGRVTQEALAP